jgi:hypothetical protein
MAMNEDSVVSSLNELRRMANDRARRETEARARVEDRGGWDQRGHGARRRTTEVQGGPAGHNPTLLGGHEMAGQPQAGYGYGYGYNQSAQPAMPDMPAEAPRQKSAVGPVLLTILLLGGAAGGGYWKLQQDWQATLRARDQALLSAEEGRNKAVEQAARAEQLAKVQIANCTKGGAAPDKAAALTPASAATPAAAAIVPPAATKPVVAARPAKAEKLSKRARRAAARRSMARVALPPQEEEKKPAAALPKLAGKKKLNDDPLAGLKM